MKSLSLRLTLSIYVKRHALVQKLYEKLNLLLCFETLATLYNSPVQPYFDSFPPLWDTRGKQLKDKLQKNENRAGRDITGSSYDIRLVDVLDNLKQQNLKTRHSHIKAIPMYKILNDQAAPHLRGSFTNLNDTGINYSLLES